MRRWPRHLRGLCVLAMVGSIAAARWALRDYWVLEQYPFTPYLLAVIAASATFDRPAGTLAVCASLICGYAQHGMPLEGARLALGAGLFITVSTSIVLTVERLQHAVVALQASERHRALLLKEYRHRSRNDLQNLTSLLLLRARRASPEAREALREAAAHARALAQVHTRLSAAMPDEGGEAVICTREFLTGLVADLERGAAGDGLRPIALVVEAVQRPLSTERGVSLGLIVNECVANALKYAFPGEQAGTVRVVLAAERGVFTLTIEDDGIGLPAGTEQGLGTRLLVALASQLRGRFSRVGYPDGGTLCTLQFPVAEPHPTRPA